MAERRRLLQKFLADGVRYVKRASTRIKKNVSQAEHLVMIGSSCKRCRCVTETSHIHLVRCSPKLCIKNRQYALRLIRECILVKYAVLFSIV